MEWQVLLSGILSDLRNPNKKTWQPEEMKKVYELVNAHDGTRLVDTGCAMCRRSTVTRARKIAETYLKSQGII